MEPRWTALAPHRPLRQGDSLYADRPSSSGARLADRVRAGWRRIAIIGPMGVGKSTELAAAQHLLQGDRFAFRYGVDRTFNMRQVQGLEVVLEVIRRFLEAKPDAEARASLERLIAMGKLQNHAELRDILRRALRNVRNATLLIDGLEKASAPAASMVMDELFSVSDDAEVVLVMPVSIEIGPGAALLQEDIHPFHIRAVLVWGEPSDEAARGRLFLREVALRHLGVEQPSPTLLALVDDACVASGGVPRVVLQLLRDAYRYAAMERRTEPKQEDLEEAKRDHGEQLRRMLLPGDAIALAKAEGRDGLELEPDKKLRFLLNGLSLEYERGAKVVMHAAPVLAKALGIPQVGP